MFFGEDRMKRFITLISLALTLSLPAHAWVTSQGVTISEMTQWQDSGPIHIKLSNGVTCYIPSAEKNLYGLAMTIFVTRKTAMFHCHDAAESFGGLPAYRVHRILATQ
jgi:hypothetical protein